MANQEKQIKTREKIFLAVYIVTPLVLILLPVDALDHGPVICPSKFFFNFECLGCGMTRAVMHLIHFDFKGARYYNPLSYVVAPVLTFLWLKWTWRSYKTLKSTSSY